MIVNIQYSDWLLKTRGKIEPKVGDKIKVLSKNRSMVNRSVTNISYPTKFLVSPQDYHNCTRIETSKTNSFSYNECYVEIELPEIKWKELSTNIRRYHGSFNNLPVFIILEMVDGCVLLDYSNLECNSIWFRGNLDECKIKANELLWKI